MNLDHTPQPDRAIDLLPDLTSNALTSSALTSTALTSAAPSQRFSLGRLITFGFAWMFGLEPFLNEPGALSPRHADAARGAKRGR
jgi:hypothetical protein